MKSLADGLPAEIAQQVHPDWRKNEAAYWAVRDQLLAQYQGQWIGFADGAVIAAASTPLEVFLAVQQPGAPDGRRVLRLSSPPRAAGRGRPGPWGGGAGSRASPSAC